MWSELTGTFGMRLKTVIQTSIFNSLLLLRKVFPYLLVGTAIGALIHGLLPVSVVQKVAGIPAWFSVPAAALIGIPLYIRTETIIPMATVLQSVGLGPGVLVSLMIGGRRRKPPRSFIAQLHFYQEDAGSLSYLSFYRRLRNRLYF